MQNTAHQHATSLEEQHKSLLIALGSARYILEDCVSEEGMERIADATGLPMGVIVAAFEVIFNSDIDAIFEEDSNRPRPQEPRCTRIPQRVK
jgi:hypothetical protein